MSDIDLAKLDCIPCLANTQPMSRAEVDALLTQLPGWDHVDGHHLRKWYDFANYADGLGFVIQVSILAEREGHHPNVHLSYEGVGIEIWSRREECVTLRDLLLASLIDRIRRIPVPGTPR